MAVAIAVTLREDVGLRWFGPDFIAPGADLPEAELGEKPPVAPVIHVSTEGVTLRGKHVVSADEAISDPDLIVDGLYKEILLIAEIRGLMSGYHVIVVDPDGRVIPTYGPEDDLIIQADRDVEFELLSCVLYTCGQAEYGTLNLAAINPDSRELEVFSLELPSAGYTEFTPASAEPEPEPEPEPALIIGDDSLKLGYRDASGEGVFNTFEKDYSVLTEELRQMKRRRPGQKSLIIICAGDVKYEELIHVIEVLVQPEIALTEIYLSSKRIEDLDK